MANYNYEHNKVFGIREYLQEGQVRIDPEIIIHNIEYVSKLLESVEFENITINMENQNLNFFPSRKLAEDYLDAICKPTN